MTTIHPLHPADPESAARLIASVPEGHVQRQQLLDELPDILETALGMILDDLDASPGNATSGAIGCRIIAACIARLKD